MAPEAPKAAGGTRGQPRRGTALVLIGLLTALTAVLLIVFVLRLARHPGAKVQLGTPTFSVGRSDRLAGPVAAQGPLLFQALRGGSLDLYIQHLGTQPRQGWLAFEAHAAGAPRRCQLRWDQTARRLSDPCSTATYPADGTGLPQYAVSLDPRGNVIVDLRQPLPPGTKATD